MRRHLTLTLAAALMLGACGSSPTTPIGLDLFGPDTGAPDLPPVMDVPPHPDVPVDIASEAPPADVGPDGADLADASAPDTGVQVTPLSAPASGVFSAETTVTPDGTFAVWMDISNGGVANGFSVFTGGAWTTADHTSADLALGDPVAAVDAAGTLYYGYLDGSCPGGNCANGHVWMTRRTAGATAFDTPVDISPADPTEFYDKPWLMVAGDGSLVATFAARAGNYPNNVDHLVAARTTDGTTWNRVDAVPVRPMGQLAGIAHACASTSTNTVWLVHVDSQTPIFAALRWSDDAGQTWNDTDTSSNFAAPSEANTLQSYDLRCVGDGDEVWVMHGLGTGGSGAEDIPPLDEIHLAYSSDHGRTFTDQVVLKEPGRKYLRPEVVIESPGHLSIIAYTGTGEGDDQGAIRWWRSSDNGATFAEAMVLLSPIQFTGSRATTAWIGDYSGLSIAGGSLIATVADNHSGTSQIVAITAPLPR
jgi:hypothetical protein